MYGLRFLKMLPPVRLLIERLERIEARLAGMETILLDPMAVIEKRQSIGLSLITLQNPALTDHVLEMWALLRPRDVVGGRKIRKGRDFDGGYVMLDFGLKDAVVYSLGIGEDVSWDLDMAKTNCEIFLYDHTIEALPAQHPNFHWSKIRIAPHTIPAQEQYSLSDLVSLNSHNDCNNIVLKMDIEGDEWHVLETLEDETLNKFSQIVIELHHLVNIDDPVHLRRVLQGLRSLNKFHQPIHVHANNFGYVGLVGGVMMPDTMEITLVRKEGLEFARCNTTFPTDLDMPCTPNQADYFLGPLGLFPERLPK